MCLCAIWLPFGNLRLTLCMSRRTLVVAVNSAVLVFLCFLCSFRRPPRILFSHTCPILFYSQDSRLRLAVITAGVADANDFVGEDGADEGASDCRWSISQFCPAPAKIMSVPGNVPCARRALRYDSLVYIACQWEEVVS